MKAVVTAAGFGTRLFPATKAVPKPMLPLGCKPILQLVMEELAQAGFDEVALLYRADQRCVREHFETPEVLRAHLQGQDGTLLRTVDEIDTLVRLTFIDCSGSSCFSEALLRAADFVAGEPFLFALADEIGPCGVRPSLSNRLRAAQSHIDYNIIAYDTRRVRPEQIRHAPHELRRIEDLEWTAEDLFIVGRFLFARDFLEELRRWQQPGEPLGYLAALNEFARRGRLLAVPFSDGWWHCGTHGEYQKAFIQYALGQDDEPTRETARFLRSTLVEATT
jgi:UTP-glucose-1-phosphate uridylyltransferase